MHNDAAARARARYLKNIPPDAGSDAEVRDSAMWMWLTAAFLYELHVSSNSVEALALSHAASRVAHGLEGGVTVIEVEA